MLSLDEAILHYQGDPRAGYTECAEERLQLAEWLRELKIYKNLAGNGRLLVKVYEICKVSECNHCGHVENRIEERWVRPGLLKNGGFYKTRKDAEKALQDT